MAINLSAFIVSCNDKILCIHNDSKSFYELPLIDENFSSCEKIKEYLSFITNNSIISNSDIVSFNYEKSINYLNYNLHVYCIDVKEDLDNDFISCFSNEFIKLSFQKITFLNKKDLDIGSFENIYQDAIEIYSDKHIKNTIVDEKEYLYKVSEEIVNDMKNQVPFPQANDFNKIIELCEKLMDGEMNKKEVTSFYGFTERQTDYYTNAAIYLDLIQYSDGVFKLSEVGREAFTGSKERKYKKICSLILVHSVFRETYELVKSEGINNVSKEQIVEIMQNNNLSNVGSLDTYKRRASTVLNWIKWIITVEEKKCEDGNFEEVKNFVLYGKYNFSFKLVFLLCFLELVKGSKEVFLDDIVLIYRCYYLERARIGLPIDNGKCIYTEEFLNDSRKVKNSIINNPLDVFVSHGYLKYDNVKGVVSFSDNLIEVMDDLKIDSLKKIVLDKLHEYYLEIESYFE